MSQIRALSSLVELAGPLLWCFTQQLHQVASQLHLVHAGKLTQLHMRLGQVPPPIVYKGAAWQMWVCQDALHAVACSSMHLAARMQAVRQKRGAAGRDALPDEVFGRLRGALFLGPSFQVTRNKLLFRDNLPELLAAAVPGELASSHHALQHSVTLSAMRGSVDTPKCQHQWSWPATTML